jgi:aldose 1-epimerase
MKPITFYLSVIILVLAGCKPKTVHAPGIEDRIWGESGGKVIKLFTLSNKNGMTIKITNLGGTLTYVSVPDKKGVFENVVLGFDSLKRYQETHPFFGSLVGRYANRIGEAKFVLDDTTYNLTANDGVNTLHGGPKGFHKQVFDIDTAYTTLDSSVLVLSLISADKEEGYPGNLKVQVRYILTGDNEIKIAYEAETDKPTVINLTNHSYFNLTSCKESILNHKLMLVSDSITPTDSLLIPTGILSPVAGTPFDFTSPHAIGERIGEVPGGYDINYKLRKHGNELSLAAEVYEPVSGRLLQTYTTEPAIQFYSGNFLNGTFTGYNGVKYNQHYGFCLEAQHFPDSPNKPQFPDVVLRPGQKYSQLTVYMFSTR